MSVEMIVVIAVVALLVMMILEVPVAFALAGSGALGLVLLRSTDVAVRTFGAVPYTATALFALVVIPMFILLGVFAVHARIAEHVFAIAQHSLRRVPGGLGIATVAACAGFAAVSGSSVATAATFGRMTVGEMRRYGYKPHLAVGIVASAGTLGALIPPSVLLVFYGIIARVSIGELLLAGIIPGILSALLYAALILIWSRRHVEEVDVDEGELAETLGEASGGRSPRLPWRGLVRVAVIFSVVMGGIYTGIFTASESGALGAALALLMLLLELRRERAAKLREAIKAALRETASLTSMVFALLVGAGIFSFFLASAGVVDNFTNWATNLDVPPAVVVALLLLLLVPFGMALDSFSIIAITVPLSFPVAASLGFDGVWFGVMVIKMAELGLISPPVGVNVYIVVGSSPGVTIEQGFRGIIPFALVDLLTIGLFFAFPGIILWLPQLVNG